MTATILQGDVRARLRDLPAQSVHCVVTSPPYWALRAYGTEAQVWGGDTSGACEHVWGDTLRQSVRGAEAGPQARVGNTRKHVCPSVRQQGAFCQLCGAWRGELGSEPHPDLFIAHLVEVFREVWRVLRNDGTCWVNLGDSYAGPPNGRSAADTKALGKDDRAFRDRSISSVAGGLKPKDLCLMPARMALALQSDGWYVRSQIVWCKLAPMPESALDRPTNAVDYLYLLTKQAKYFYDTDAVREAQKKFIDARPPSAHPHLGKGDALFVGAGHKKGGLNDYIQTNGVAYNPAGRNLWNYWLLGPEQNDAEYCRGCITYFDGPDKRRIRVVRDGDSVKRICPNCGHDDKWHTHFATFPTEIPRRAIKAGTSQAGVCGECGAPWKRAAAVDWQPTCSHDAQVVPATVLDPFSGAGTTCLVAAQLGRNGIGIELHADYAELSRQRIRCNAPVLSLAQAADASTGQQRDLFSLLDEPAAAVAG